MMVAERGKAGNIYNIGGGNEMRNIDVAKKIISYMGKSDSEIQFVKDRAGHDKRYSLDSSKAMALGWKPEKKFEDGLVETIEWYKSNEWWWKPLKAKK
jgi:dTDP-glucose 4,6-dehydratase